MGDEIKLNAREVKRLREILVDQNPYERPNTTGTLIELGFAEIAYLGERRTSPRRRVQITDAGRQWLKDHDNG